MDLTKLNEKTILSDEVFEEIFSQKDEIYKAKLLLSAQEVAERFHVKGKFDQMVKAYKRVDRETKQKKKQEFSSMDNYTNFDGPYENMYCGSWIAGETGIYAQNMATVEQIACYHPILPIERLKNLETGEEQIKLAFKRNGRWEEIIVPKVMITSAGKIVALSGRGVAVTSENAKLLVRYLSDVENRNTGQIEVQYSSSKLGWIKKEFLPYDTEITFDGDSRFRQLFESIGEHGNRDKWYEHVKSLRKSGRMEIKLMLAASFASVLLHQVGALPFFVDLWGETEGGKAQPLDTNIITPNGIKKMGEMKVGDFVIGCDGKPHKVTGVYPQGKKDVYEVSFSDGTKTRCCKEHLWTVSTITRRNHNRGTIVMSLEEIIKSRIKKGKAYNFRIPVCNPVEFESNQKLPIDSYLLGTLIGDGCLTMKENERRGTYLYFSNMESDVLERVNLKLLERDCELKRNTYTQCQYIISGKGKIDLEKDLKSLGLNGKSADRFIPDCYKFSSISERKELLAGLFDTDGSVEKFGKYEYCTKSKQLANDIQSLCRSLGYRATLRTYERKGYEYYITVLTDEEIFKSDKHKEKADLHKIKRNRAVTRNEMSIVDVKKVGYEECQCIMVDSKEHTYLCDDYIVTHNTVTLMLAASVWANPAESAYIGDFKTTDVALEAKANMLNHLPMILDDTSKKNRRIEENFEGVVYDLCSGKGKTRSNRDIGINTENHWNNCILTNGERPMTSYVNQGGAINRILEIECGEKVYSDPQLTADTLKQNYGFSGKDFVEVIKAMGADAVREIQKDFQQKLFDDEKMQKQSISLSIILTADKIATDTLFKDGQYISIDEAKKVLIDRNELSDNERCYRYIMDKVAMNGMRFDADTNCEKWGIIENGYAVFYNQSFDELCKSGGFSKKSFLSWAAKKKIIVQSGGKNTKSTRINGNVVRCVWLKIEEMPEFEIDEKGIIQIDEQMELPFE